LAAQLVAESASAPVKESALALAEESALVPAEESSPGSSSGLPVSPFSASAGPLVGALLEGDSVLPASPSTRSKLFLLRT